MAKPRFKMPSIGTWPRWLNVVAILFLPLIIHALLVVGLIVSGDADPPW